MGTGCRIGWEDGWISSGNSISKPAILYFLPRVDEALYVWVVVRQRQHVEVLRLLGSVDAWLLAPQDGPLADVGVALNELIKQEGCAWGGTR